MTNQKIENSESSGLEVEKQDKPSPKLKMVTLGLLVVIGVFIIYDQYQDYKAGAEVSKGNVSGVVQLPANSAGEKPQIDSLAPDFISEDVFGKRVALSDFRNQKPVLLIFWATWCGYCAQELPDLKTFTQKHQAQVQVLAVASGETKPTIKEYIQEKEVNFTILLDEQKEIWNTYLVRGTPAHFLIDQEGKIITLIPGLATMSDLEIMLSML